MTRRSAAGKRSYAESSDSDNPRKTPRKSQYFEDGDSFASEDTEEELPYRDSVDKTEDSDLEAGETFIPKLPALPEGDAPYSAKSIHSNSLLFLTELGRNNERPWFQQRDLQYQATKQDFDSFVLELGRTIRSVDETIPELPAKDLTFRIYRDIRFSNDQTPYKKFLAAYFSRSGRKGPWAGYYFSLEPHGKTLLAAGLWQPPPEDLLLLRESIASDFDRWLEILDDPDFRQFFGGREGLLTTEDKLKTAPKGFDKAHKHIAFLRLKSFNVSIRFTDEEVTTGEEFLDILTLVIEQAEKLVTLLNSIIRPEESSD